MAAIRKSLNPIEVSRHEFTHEWAERAVMNIKNVAGCLTWQGKDDDQLDFLGSFLGDVVDSFLALKTQKDRFDFDYFSHAIDEPIRVFEFDDSPASYHSVAEDLVYSLVPAVFPQYKLSKISRQDAEMLSAADIKRIVAALSDTTGSHDLRDFRKRLSRLTSGLAKEYARLRSAPPTAIHDGTSDTKSGHRKKTVLPKMSNSVDVQDLCRRLQKELPTKKNQSQIAREFTGETSENDRKAQNLLRQARRYRHLWDKRRS